jgi:NAD(P)-dependent dehydrogenase (short-subunit alcohol dehydrogenase family)
MIDDSLETQFQANHFGHFLLTSLLMPLLKSSPSGKARVVNVSSMMHQQATAIPFDDINFQQNPASYSSLKVYGITKLANVLFTNELARRYKVSVTNQSHLSSLT